MNAVTDTMRRGAAFSGAPRPGGLPMFRRLLAALRRWSGIHPRRRFDDRPRWKTARELVDEGMREMIRNPGRRHDDVLGRVRNDAELRRRASDRRQMSLFPQEGTR